MDKNINLSQPHHGLLVEKYRPSTLEGYVGNETIKSKIQQFIDSNNVENLTFYGTAGCGKTTLAKIIVKNIDCDYLYINASDERGIETIRDKVKGFASTASFKPLKVIILDEADFLTLQAQASLRNVIETFSESTRFILTCNHLDRIWDKIQSRCKPLQIVPLSKSQVAKHLNSILIQEEISFELTDLKKIVNKFYPDIRLCLNNLQFYTNNKTLVLDESLLLSAQYMSEIIQELSKPKPNFTTLRQIINDSNMTDFEGLYRLLFEKSSTYCPGNEGSVAIILNEHLYQSNFRIDKEINICSCIAKIIKLKQ